MMDEIIRYKIHVAGQVQGVGFRWSAVHEAKNRGLTGLVKNLADGRVYMEAEGSREQLDAFIEWCKKGPDFSRVQSVTVDSCTAVHYRDFRIEH